ncbi:gag-pol polyprotein, partial [Tanacetum coccineum]
IAKCTTIHEHGSKDRPPMLGPGRYSQWRSPEKEAIFLILTGIGDEIYSTVDACKTTKEMWIAIERIQQGVSLNVPRLLFDVLKQFQNEVNDIRSERLARSANPLALLAAAQPYSDNYYQAPKLIDRMPPFIHAIFFNTTNSNQITSPEGIKVMHKELGNSLLSTFQEAVQTYQQQPSNFFKSGNMTEDTTPRIYNNVNQSLACFNCKGFELCQECRKPKAGLRDYAYQKIDTDEEIDEQRIEDITVTWQGGPHLKNPVLLVCHWNSTNHDENDVFACEDRHLSNIFCPMGEETMTLDERRVDLKLFAPILGYGDLIQGNVTIKRVYYAEGLNHNLFSVGQFCDADIRGCFQIYLFCERSSGKTMYDDTTEVLNGLFRCFNNNLQAQVITVRTDRGMKFLNKTLHAYFKEEGDEHQTSIPRTPEQNGVVERRNRTRVEEPSLKHLHILVALVITRDGENLDKMKEKGDPCVMVGYSTQSKGYHVYNKRTRLIAESIHIKFDEIKENDV